MISGNDQQRIGEGNKQPLEVFVFYVRAAVDEIARTYDEVRLRPHRVEMRDAALECGRGIDDAIGLLAGAFDVQIRYLRDEERGRGHCGLASGRNRITVFSIRRPTLSPTLTATL